VGFYGPIAPPVPNAPVRNAHKLRSQHDATPPDQTEYPGERRAAAAVPLPESPCRENFKMYLLRQFCSNWVKFFYNTQDGPEFWNSNSVIFDNFLKFSKRRRAVPLRPILTIMVAAKLDQSRVLVTKFRQNRLMLKGRSAGQRHIATHRQTRLKIMALQVCNRANKPEQ